MTQQMDDLMKMAREAGAIPIREKPKDVALVGIDAIERFAQLVAKKAVESDRKRLQEIDWTTVMREGGLVTWGDASDLGDRVIARLIL